MTTVHGYHHRARVLAADGDTATVEIPSLASGAPWGPLPTAVPNLAPGDGVLVAQIGVSQDTLIVISRVPGRVPDQSEIPGLADVIADLQAADAAIEADVAAANGALDTRLDAAETTLAGHTTAIADNATRVTALEALRHRGVNVTTLVQTGSLVYVALGSDDISLTLPYPASGRATIAMQAAISGTAVNVYGLMSFEIRDTNAAGTLRVSAVDDNSIFNLSVAADTTLGTVGGSTPAFGLPTTGTMFIRAMYRSNGGSNTAKFAYRRMSVLPSP